MAEYEPRVMRKVAQLRDRITAAQGQPMLVNDLMRWFSFDLMGDFAFSQDFGMMENREYHRAIRMLRSAITLLGPFSPAIWIPRLGFAFIPGLWKTDIKERDIASWFIEDVKGSEDNSEHMRWLSGDTATVVVAGRQELSKIDIDDVKAVGALPHLNGAINEAMRLLPAVLTFVTRVTPGEGLVVGETFIPGNVKIAAPRYSIGRLKSAWDQPHQFCPARWYSQLEKIRDKRAFAPFGLGRTSCVGKELAMTEIRMVVANLLANFDISFPPGDNGEAVERDMKDQLTANPGELFLKFETRFGD
ncbi:MAG: hypothetical protein Q9180_004579 [Flavoplaca navasiana]